jgi:hypothetical protein
MTSGICRSRIPGKLIMNVLKYFKVLNVSLFLTNYYTREFINT